MPTGDHADEKDAWDRLKAEAQERRESAIALATGSESTDPAPAANECQDNERPSQQDEEWKAPSTPTRSQLYQDHARRPSSTSTSTVLSPPASRRGTGNRMGDNEFIRRQLGGMIRERTKSVEEVPTLQKRSRGPSSSMSTDGEKELGHRILGHAKADSALKSPGNEENKTFGPSSSTMFGEEVEEVLDWTEMPEDGDETTDVLHHTSQAEPNDPANARESEQVPGMETKGQDLNSVLTPLQQARQRVEESRKAKRAAEMSTPEKPKKQGNVKSLVQNEEETGSLSFSFQVLGRS